MNKIHPVFAAALAPFAPPATQKDECPHVAATGSHHFEWSDESFDHEFGREHRAGYMLCDCGADPNDHGMYDASLSYGDYTPDVDYGLDVSDER